MKYLFKNTALFAMSEIATKVINFVLVPLYTYVLTKEQYGTANLVFTFSTLFTPLVMFNIGEALMRFLLDKDADDSKIRHVEFTVIIFGFIVSLVFIPIIRMMPSVRDYAVYMYIYLVFSALRNATVGYLRGKEKLFQYAICNIVNTFLVASLNIYFLVVLKAGVRGYLLAYIIACGTTGLLAFFLGRQLKNYEHGKLDREILKKMIRFSLAVVPNTMMWWVINSSDHLMVSYIKSVDENGLLTVSYKIPALLTTFSTIAMQGWKYSAINERESKDRMAFNNKVLSLFFRSVLLVSASLLLLNKVLVGILYSDAYFDSWRATSFLLFGNVFMSVATFFGTSYYVEKKMVGNLVSAMIGAAMNIGFNAILIPQYGAAGATMAAAASYVAIMLFRYFDTQKYLRLNFWTSENIVLMLLLLALLVCTNIGYVHISIAIFAVIVAINSKFIIIFGQYGVRIIKGILK